MMHPPQLFFPIIYAMFIWWFTTGLIIVVYGRSDHLQRLGFLGATLALLVAFMGLLAVRDMTSVRAAYVSVTCGIVIWGWQVAGYYMGFITGIAHDDDLLYRERSLPRRFVLALRSSIYHELMAVGFIILLLAATWQSPNQWGVWMYIALWTMHVSAKLNVFFGVRNFRIDFLPRHLHHLEQLAAKRKTNVFFPFAVVFSTSVVGMLIYQAIVPTATATETAGLLLISTMVTLGIVEHWLLVLPLPAILWGWGIRSMPESPPTSETTVPKSIEPIVREKSITKVSQ
jgi:putative photosynthetic complex assembly protein 2